MVCRVSRNHAKKQGIPETVEKFSWFHGEQDVKPVCVSGQFDSLFIPYLATAKSSPFISKFSPVRKKILKKMKNKFKI